MGCASLASRVLAEEDGSVAGEGNATIFHHHHYYARPALPGDVIKARMRGGALYLPLKGMSLPIFFSVLRKKRRTEQKERRMAGKRLQMTFVTSEIWLRLLLAANGCSSHVTTSECTRGRGGERRGEERPRRRRRRGAAESYASFAKHELIRRPLLSDGDPKGKGVEERRNTKGERADGEWHLSQ